jgi:hypothetical protein
MYSFQDYEVEYKRNPSAAILKIRCTLNLFNTKRGFTDVENISRLASARGLSQTKVEMAVKECCNKEFYNKREFLENLFFELGRLDDLIG